MSASLLVRLVLPILLFVLPVAALAQAPQTPPAAAVEAPPPEQVRELMRLLSDERMVAWMRRNADNIAAAGPADEAGGTFVGELESRMAGLRARIADLAAAWSNFPLVPDVLAEAWRTELSRGEALRSLTYVLIFLFVGAGFEWLFWQYFHPIHLRIELGQPTFLLKRLTYALSRLLLQTTALVLFSIGSIGAFVSFSWPPFLERIVVDLLIGVIGLRTTATLSRFILAPRTADLRLVPLSDGVARKVHRWFVFVAAVLIASFVTTDALTTLARGPSGSRDAVSAALAVSVVLGAVTTLVLVAMVWNLSQAIARERPPETLKLRFEPLAVKVMPIVITVIIVPAYLFWVFGATELMWTLLILGFLPPAVRMTRAIVDHFFDRAEGIPMEGEAAPSEVGEAQAAPAVVEVPAGDAPAKPAPDRFATYRPIVRRLARFLLAILALVALASAWGTDLVLLSDSPSMAGRAVKVVVDIIAALLIADLVWVWAKTAIDRRLASYVPPPPGESPGPEARMATLLPLLRNILLVAVVVLVGLTILSSLGVNIAPLLAGAGIAGVAIGFGTQSLVRDIVSGIFFLLDDAFRIGEYIEMENLRGTVESMSLRSLRVRHHRGAVHSIPFGELKSLTNYSRDWVIMKLEFRVPFETDLMLVKKLVKKVGAELQADPNYGSQIIEPLKSQGVRRMEEFNMVVGVKFMAKPGAQWVIRRDAYQKLRDAFDKNGIVFAQRNVKVEVLGDRPLTDEARTAIAGAAQEAIERRAAPQPVADEP